MKFLVDAQLPLRLARYLADEGHDSIHTTELPDGNRTTDRLVAELADAQGRVVVTKDRDFRDGHVLQGTRARLLVVATGNSTNTTLVSLFERHLGDIVGAFEEADFVELGVDSQWCTNEAKAVLDPDCTARP